MLFGTQRVSARMHTLATFLVAFGTTLSAFWIIALNSWMHTPQGFQMIGGKAFATNWLEIIFNPSMIYRLLHMLTASALTVAFLIAGICAYRYLKGSRASAVLLPLRAAITMAAILVPVQMVLGDLHGLNTLHYQPAKLAAMEGIWKTQRGVPAILFGWPDSQTQSNHYEVAIPKLGSLYLTHQWEGEVKGLDQFKDRHPPVRPVFFAFRLMVGIGLLMLLVAWWGKFYMRNKERVLAPFFLRALVAMTFSGWIAILAGWYVTEIGRQPYLVYGVLTTAQAAGPATFAQLGSTLVMYLCLYIGLIFAYVATLFYLARQADNPTTTNDFALSATGAVSSIGVKHDA